MSTDNQNLSSEILAPGRQITLANGNRITLRYGFRALQEIERAYGSVNGLLDILNKAENGPAITTIGHVLWAGSSRKLPLDAFLDLLDPRKTTEYSEAFSAAIQESLGTGDEPGEAEAASAAQ